MVKSARPLLLETDDNGYVIDDRAKWFPEFKDLTQEELTFVALITDYNSLLFGLPDSKRRIIAAEKINKERGTNISFNVTIEAASKLYNSIQYDNIAEQLSSQKNIMNVFTEELNKLSVMGENKQDVEKIIKATEMQQRAEKEIDRLEKKFIERITEDSKTRGDRVTNFYEVWRKNNDVSKIAVEGIKNYKESIGNVKN